MKEDQLELTLVISIIFYLNFKSSFEKKKQGTIRLWCQKLETLLFIDNLRQPIFFKQGFIFKIWIGIRQVI